MIGDGTARCLSWIRATSAGDGQLGGLRREPGCLSPSRVRGLIIDLKEGSTVRGVMKVQRLSRPGDGIAFIMIVHNSLDETLSNAIVDIEGRKS
jgi:hypothetical protein